jgi:hypothetical protein
MHVADAAIIDLAAVDADMLSWLHAHVKRIAGHADCTQIAMRMVVLHQAHMHRCGC